MNKLREKILGGEAARGVWLMLPSVESARMLAQLPLDWCLIDAEHAPIDDLTLAHITTSVADSGGPAPIIRVADNTVAAIKRGLDVGAWGIIVPMVNNETEAQAAVRAAKFPPLGERSFGSPYAPVSFKTTGANYLKTANDETLLIVQIESQQAVKNIHKILKVKGVDLVFIGPADLSISLGLPLDFSNPHPNLETAIAKVLKAAKKAGIPAGIYCPNGEIAAQRIKQGFQLVNVTTDLTALLGGVQAQLDASR